MNSLPAHSFDFTESGPRFKEIRLSLGIKQREITQVTGIHAGNLSRFEKGEKVLQTSKVLALFRAIGCEVLAIQRIVVMPPVKLTKGELADMERYAQLTCGSETRDVNNENVDLRQPLGKLASGTVD